MIKDRELLEVYHPILPHLEKVEKEIEKNLRISQLTIPEFLRGGKRLRSACVLFSAKAYEKADENLIRLSTGIELIHASSLIHDDIVDNARFRRESEALSFKYGNSIAVLAGDYLFVRAIYLISSLGRKDILEEVLKTTSLMIEGELEEETFTVEEKSREETYLQIIRKKTASLFKTAFKVGALWRKEGEDDETSLFASLGTAFGMAYQIIDDCMDLFSEEDCDAAQRKLTLPIIHAFSKGGEIIDEYLKSGFSKPMREKVESLGSFDYALLKADSYIKNAYSLLENIEDRNLRDYLGNFLSYLYSRSYKVREAFLSS